MLGGTVRALSWFRNGHLRPGVGGNLVPCSRGVWARGGVLAVASQAPFCALPGVAPLGRCQAPRPTRSARWVEPERQKRAACRKPTQ